MKSKMIFRTVEIIKKSLLIVLLLIGNFVLTVPIYAADIIQEQNTFEIDNKEVFKESLEELETYFSESDMNQAINAVEVKALDLGDYSDKMKPGEKQLLMITTIPSNATDQEIFYFSSNTAVATVNGLGRIIAINEGNTNITVICGDISENFILTVKDDEIPISDIELSECEDKLAVGDTLSLKATVIPSDATDSVIHFNSSNPAIAIVNSSGEVKGISSGMVDIIVTAGSVIKKISLDVYVKTANIELERDYFILKPNEEIQLKAKVMPKEAKQKITYRSANKEIATVSSSGLVRACSLGNTAILISNGEMTVSASVIVGKENKVSTGYKSTSGANRNENISYDTLLSVSEYPIITEEMLSYYYLNNSIVCISGEDYFLLMDGNEIVNVQNCLLTNIYLNVENEGISFILNDSNHLPGPVTICLDNAVGKYLYLYNTSKDKYERIVSEDYSKIKLSSGGRYLLTEKKMRGIDRFVVGVMVCGIIVIVLAGAIYIVIRKKHWFW